MAQLPLKPCRHPGCPTLTRDSWCERHRPQHKRRVSQDYHGWYNLPIWTDFLRPDQLLAEPFCRSCAAKGIRTCATVVDHIRPHRGIWELFVDRGNLQSLCKSCHDRKTAKEQAQDRREFDRYLPSAKR